MRFNVQTATARRPRLSPSATTAAVYAYLNRCAHIPVELDWMEGEFFDKAGLYLICATHGATYEPDTGHCVMGPCKGQHLAAVAVEERDGQVYLAESENHDG